MKRGVFRSTLAWVVALGLVGCATSGTTCAGCSEPIPGGFPPDQRVNNAVSTKISANGLKFLESRVNDLVGLLATNGLSFDVPCTDATQSFNMPLGLGTLDEPIFACDTNGDHQCTSADASPANRPGDLCKATAAIKTLKITPTQNPDGTVTMAVLLQLRVNTGKIKLLADLTGPGGWHVCDLGCSVEYDSDRAAPPEIPINVPLNLKLDPAYGDILAFDVGNIDVAQIFDPSDLDITRDLDNICSYLCTAVNVDFVKNMIFNFMKGTINTKLRDTIDKFRCRPCEAVTHNCPSGSSCNASQGVCYVKYAPNNDPSKDTRICPPAQMGLEGRVGVGNFMSSFGAPPESMMDLYAVAGGKNPDGKPSTKVEAGGLVLGIMGGTRPVVRDLDGNPVAPGQAACVPLRTFAPRPQPTAINFDQSASDAVAQFGNIADYHLGLGISDNFLDKSLFDAFQAGLLCLNVDSHVSTFLSSALFRTFLPSLGQLTHGQDVPMLIALRPKNAPNVIIGKGTTHKDQNGDEVPDDPLITVEIKGMQIDFYALVEERYARLFSLTTDIRLPLSLKFDAARNSVQPVLANLETVVSNINAQNSEMLAENPQIVADLLDAIIGLVQPILASVLTPIDLPTFNGFKLQVRAVEGANKLPAPAPGYEHLALFANLNLGTPLTMGTDTEAQLVGGHVPDGRTVAGDHLRPFATLQVKGNGLHPVDFQGYEYAWRVDGGLWSPWTRREQFEVHAPVLMLQGRHTIEVISRVIGSPESEDPTPALVPFVVDYDAPAVRLDLDQETRQVRTVAHDAVSRDDELSFRYRVAGGEWTQPGAAQVFTVAELGADPSLEVEVTDAAGRVATSYFGTPADQLGTSGPARDGGEHGGCSQTGASALALAALALVALRRRSRQA